MSAPRRKPPVARSAARLGAVQALYQMDLAGTDVGEVLAQFSSRAAGDAFDEGQCGPADFPFLKEVVDGVVREQRTIDPILNRLQPLELLAAAFAPRDVRFRQCGVGGIELAIDKAAQQQVLIGAGSH